MKVTLIGALITGVCVGFNIQLQSYGLAAVCFCNLLIILCFLNRKLLR